MTQPESTTIRRRPDGAIDISFYARRAAHERRIAMRALPACWLRRAIRTLATAGQIHPAHRSAPSHPGRF